MVIHIDRHDSKTLPAHDEKSPERPTNTKQRCQTAVRRLPLQDVIWRDLSCESGKDVGWSTTSLSEVARLQTLIDAAGRVDRAFVQPILPPHLIPHMHGHGIPG